jgi:hypothetical protein
MGHLAASVAHEPVSGLSQAVYFLPIWHDGGMRRCSPAISASARASAATGRRWTKCDPLFGIYEVNGSRWRTVAACSKTPRANTTHRKSRSCRRVMGREGTRRRLESLCRGRAFLSSIGTLASSAGASRRIPVLLGLAHHSDELLSLYCRDWNGFAPNTRGLEESGSTGLCGSGLVPCR